MKKIDLNIELKEVVKGEDGKTELSGFEVAKNWIGIMLERAINKPDPRTRQATATVNMQVQRKYFKVMNAIDDAKKGIAEIEDDDFVFLDSKFHQAELPVGTSISGILVKVEDRINEAKVEKKG